MKSGKIIFINGVSSSGKSLLAIELQKRLTEDFFHIQLDDFIEMMPRTDDLEMFMRMVSGMNRSIAVMAEEQNNLIVDHVVIDKTWMDQCLELLGGRYVLFVGLHCPLEELERRERKRDSRRRGFARAQIENIHKGKIYDIELDTHVLGVEQCAEQMLDFYLNSFPTAFEKMRAAAGLTH
ncbi:MAG TPA: chloramphenicol phosphotransferase [candidate division Zixibacteria bacterium]|nr:chloramphenicol phosphotransferase [candidate division Zixibacteria bacterium]